MDTGFLRGTLVCGGGRRGLEPGSVIGATTGSQGGGGSYSVFYNAVPFGSAFTEEARVDGLSRTR